MNPDVRFVQLPFYEEIAELLKATSLISSFACSRIQISQFEFHLTPQQIQEIERGRLYYNSKYNYSIQVIYDCTIGFL